MNLESLGDKCTLTGFSTQIALNINIIYIVFGTVVLISILFLIVFMSIPLRFFTKKNLTVSDFKKPSKPEEPGDDYGLLMKCLYQLAFNTGIIPLG